MNTPENTYTEQTARAIEGIGNNLLTEAGRKKYIFEVDCLTGDFKLTNMESGDCNLHSETDLSNESIFDASKIIKSHIKGMLYELAVKEFME